MKRSLWIAGLTFLALALGRAAEAGIGDLIPSTRWLMLSSPYAPQSYAECDELRQSFQDEIKQLSAQHDACLEGTPQEPAGSAGCSKLSCQALHSARDSAQRRSNEQIGICRQGVGEYLAEQRAEEERQRQAAEDAEQERRRQEVEEAAEQAERDRAEREQAIQEDQEERERVAQEAEEARDRAAQEASEEQGRRDEVAAREQQAAREEADRRSLADQMLSNLLAQQQAAEARERAASARRAKDFFARIDEGAQEIQTRVDAAEIVAALGANPFSQPLADVLEGPLGQAAADQAREANKTMLEKGLDLVTNGLGPAEHNPTYDQLAEGVNKAHGKALVGNPFAKEVSGLALSGVEHIQRKVLGEVTELTRQIDQFGKDEQTANSSTIVLRATPPPRSDSSPIASETIDGPQNPFAKRVAPSQASSLSEEPQAKQVSPKPPQQVASLEEATLPRDNRDNPFLAKGNASSVSEVDPDSQKTVVALAIDDIQRLQEQLGAVGFNPGPADGAWGSKTRAALRAFQKARGLDPTGEPDMATLVELGIR